MEIRESAFRPHYNAVSGGGRVGAGANTRCPRVANRNHIRMRIRNTIRNMEPVALSAESIAPIPARAALAATGNALPKLDSPSLLYLSVTAVRVQNVIEYLTPNPSSISRQSVA